MTEKPKKKLWPYNKDPMRVEMAQTGSDDRIIYTIDLVKGNKDPDKAVYKKTIYNPNGIEIWWSYIDRNEDLTPLERVKDKDVLVAMEYSDYGDVMEEVFMRRVSIGLFKTKWIISKINYYTEDGQYLQSDNFVDCAEFT